MWTRPRRFAVVAVIALVAVLGSELVSAKAQTGRRLNPTGPTVFYPTRPVNPNWLVAPGVTLRQWAYNTSVLGNAYSTVPPYMFGYNPYPSPVVTYGPSYPALNPYWNPYTAYTGYNPYLVYATLYNPYLYAASLNNPYNPYGLYGYNYLYQ